MYRKLIALLVSAAAAAAATAVVKVVTDRIEKKKEEKNSSEDVNAAGAAEASNSDGDDEVNFISLDEEEPAAEEESSESSDSQPSQEKIESEKEQEPAEEPSKEEKAQDSEPQQEDSAEIPIEAAEEPAAEEQEPAEDAEFSEEVNQVAELYPYLSKAFIAEQFARNDEFTAQYPEDTLITISHKAKFADADTLATYAKIAQENGYKVQNLSDTENIISKRMFTENGSILSDIYNVANQAACLKGTYEGYNIEL